MEKIDIKKLDDKYRRGPISEIGPIERIIMEKLNEIIEKINEMEARCLKKYGNTLTEKN